MKYLTIMTLGLGLVACAESPDAQRTHKYIQHAGKVKEAQAELQKFLDAEGKKCAPKVLQLDGNGFLLCVEAPKPPASQKPEEGKK